jgi:hypothetical protein
MRALHVLLGPLSKKNVMQKMMVDLEALCFILESTCKQASLIVAQNEIINGLKNSLPSAMKFFVHPQNWPLNMFY